MLEAVVRKTRRLFEDPVLRRWTIGVALGRVSRPVAFVANRPPYTEGLVFPRRSDAPDRPCVAAFKGQSFAFPQAPIRLNLPGVQAVVTPDAPASLFERAFADTEVLLAVHRFAWLPLAGLEADPDWVDALWSLWLRKFSEPDTGWAWHPYTAAERAINILDFASRHGMPGDLDETVRSLACHAEVIADRLEYFGDHNTSNHLSNNGRGLYRIGLALGLRQAAELGCAILLSEAARLFGRSGLLREGSTHYHLLLSRNYIDCWLAAEGAGRPEANELKRIAARALAAVPHIVLPGGLPLVGDISPDCPPEFLSGLLPGLSVDHGWSALLSPQQRKAVDELKADHPRSSAAAAAADGWINLAGGAWAILFHAPVAGWPPMPGHAHQDLASFEAHWEDMPLIVDPGRGAYGESGEAAFYVTAAAHNGLSVDDNDPYPSPKPYYATEFRRTICGPDPLIERDKHRVVIAHGGFTRLSGVGLVRRSISIDGPSLIVEDSIAGSASRTIQRRLHTPWPVAIKADSAMIQTPKGIFRVTTHCSLRVKQTKRWVAYGVSQPAYVIVAEARVGLPADTKFVVEPIGA